MTAYLRVFIIVLAILYTYTPLSAEENAAPADNSAVTAVPAEETPPGPVAYSIKGKSFLTLESGFFGYHHIKYTRRDKAEATLLNEDSDYSEILNTYEINYKNLGDTDSFFIGDFFRIGGGKALREWLLVGLSGGLGFYSPGGAELIGFSVTPFAEFMTPKGRIRLFVRTGVTMNFYHMELADSDYGDALDYLIGKAAVTPGLRFFISENLSLEAMIGLNIGGGRSYADDEDYYYEGSGGGIEQDVFIMEMQSALGLTGWF